MRLQEIFDKTHGDCRILFEMRIMTPTGPLLVLRNPPISVLTDLVISSKWSNVRGLVVGRDIYYWDSAFATHDDIAKHLGVEDREEDHIILSKESNSIYCALPPVDNIRAISSRLKPMLSDPEYVFGIDDHDFTGAEIAQKLAA